MITWNLSMIGHYHRLNHLRRKEEISCKQEQKMNSINSMPLKYSTRINRSEPHMIQVSIG